jgi:hypothetical protein
MEKIIVLETSGRGNDVECVKIKLCDTVESATTYCKSVTSDENEKYWTLSEIVDENVLYEMTRSENIREYDI